MVVYRIAILFSLIFCVTDLLAQNIYFDEINLMNHQRNIQLIDSNKKIETSFLIRSSQQFQSIQASQYPEKRKKIVQNFYVGYDHVNNSLLPQNWNDGIMYPARGWQERYTIGLQLK